MAGVFDEAPFGFVFEFIPLLMLSLLCVLSSSTVASGSLSFPLVSIAVVSSEAAVVSVLSLVSSSTATASPGCWSGTGGAGEAQVTMPHATPVKDFIGRVLLVHRRHLLPDRSSFLDAADESADFPVTFGWPVPLARSPLLLLGRRDESPSSL